MPFEPIAMLSSNLSDSGDDDDLREYFAECQKEDSDHDSISSSSEDVDDGETNADKRTNALTPSPPLPAASAETPRTLLQSKRRLVRMDAVPTARDRTEGGEGGAGCDVSLDRYRGSDVQKVAAALRSDKLQVPLPVAGKCTALTTLRRRVLFDFFCALRQSANCTFVSVDTPSRVDLPSWQWRNDVATQVQRSLGVGFYATMTSALVYANDMAALAAELRQFEKIKTFLEAYLQRDSDDARALAAAFNSEAVACHGTGAYAVRADDALTVASLEALHRLYTWASGIYHELGTWVLAVQELGEAHAWWCTLEGSACALHTRADDDDKVAWPHFGKSTGTDGNASWSVSELFRCVEHNMVPLQRCLAILEEARCFRGVAEWVDDAQDKAATAAATNEEQEAVSEDETTFASVCAEYASGMMDFLIIRVSAFQSTATMDLYRLYMTLLLTCSWPYVRLSTAVLFGLVTGVSPQLWRRQLPRLFRLSFSHIRVSSAMRRQFPTDILSLLLNCLGYEGDDGCANFTHRGAPRHENDRERKALSALRSSRTFVLRSLCTFASRKYRMRQQEKRKTTTAVVPPKKGDASSGDASLGPQSSMNDILNTLLRGGDNVPMRHLTSFLSEKAQRRWHRAAGLPYAGEDTVAPTVDTPGAPKVYYPTLVPMGFYTNDEVPPHTGRVGGDGEEDEEEDVTTTDTKHTAHSSRLTSSLTRLQPTVWSLRSMGTKSAAVDLQLLNLTEMKKSEADFMEELWINTSVPAARWVAAAILLPVAAVVQRLQSQRLLNLFKIRSAHVAFQSSRFASDVVRSFSFLQAIKLLLDVAFCRDRARIVSQFLEKLFEEPHWWFRQSGSGGGGGRGATPPRRGTSEAATATDAWPGARDDVSTASPLITSLFAEAVRGKTFGDMVRLEVLPEDSAGEKVADENLVFAYDMLDVFASFQLHFSFPDEFALILLPRELSMYVRRATESIESNYSILFWRRRRGPTGPAATTAAASAGTAPSLTVTAADVWSYAFGYLCSLLYAQIVLKNQRKELHIKDVQDHGLMTLMGKSPQSHSHLGHIARGLGGAYYSLSFVVDTLLSFTYREANTVVYKLERLLKNTQSSTCIVLCEELDEALLGLQQICFPCRVPSFTGPRERNSLSPASKTIREHISTVLCLSIDPARLPLKFVTSRASNAIEALVTTITTLRDPDYLKMRLQPLIVSLTFNRYYGAENIISFRFR